MNYLVYKITNLINNKIYIGAHATEDINDSYMGSGVNIVKSIAKHGVENFKKDILFVFDTSKEMYAKEAELVTESFVMRTDTYNAAIGGKGNPVIVHLQNPEYRKMISERTKAGMTPEIRLRLSKLKTGMVYSQEVQDKKSIAMKKHFENKDSHLKGRKLSEEHKAKIIAGSNKGMIKQVPMIINGLHFQNAHEAGAHFNVSIQSIGNWIRDIRKSDCYKI